MSTRAQKIRLGVFMLLAFLLLLGSVVTLAGLKLWNPRDRYLVRYKESISGLDVGSAVKMKGVRVGQVERISVGKDVESVVVDLSLDPGTPIMVDTQAVLTSIGITGLQFVELTGGSAHSKRILPNGPQSYIQPGSSVIQTLTGKATDIATKMEAGLNNLISLTNEQNRTRIGKLLEDASQLAVSWAELARDNKETVKHAFANIERTTSLLVKASEAVLRLAQENTGGIRETVAAASSATQAANRMLQSMRPQATLEALNGAAHAIEKRAADPALSQAVSSLNATARQLSRLAEQLGKVVNQRDRQLGNIMVNLDRASEYLKDFSRSVKERPSLLLRGETHKERTVP